MLKPYYSYNKRINTSNQNNINNNIFMNQQQVPVSQESGYIELFVFTERGRVPIRDATVTVYARQTALIGTPIQTLTTTENPITIELPVAHPSGTLVRGPEYFFTTYNITISDEGYSPVTILNIRIFPGITENIDINLIEIIPGTLPIPEKIINIPPHPRDALFNQPYFSY